MRLDPSGALTRASIRSPLTPLFLIVAFAAGLLALAVLPREEEPQISVPMVDIFVAADGIRARDAIELVTKPLERIIKGIDQVEHVYSQTEDDRVLVTARFVVGADSDAALLRVHAEVRAHLSEIPIGIPEPLIVGRGINDVPILVVTLTPSAGNPGRWTDAGLFSLAEEINGEIAKTANVGRTFIVGGRPNQIRIEPDPERLALYGVTLNQLVEKLEAANRSFLAGQLRQEGGHVSVSAGQSLQAEADNGLLLITTRDDRPVYVGDVARVVTGGRPDEQRAWHVERTPDGLDTRPAVSIAIAKRKGSNAVTIAHQVLAHIDTMQQKMIPEGVDIRITRNYGETAAAKADELLFHLILASVSIVGLLTVFLGWREGMVVLVVIPATILMTFFAAWMMGYTINRVSMFALIFSIGILVDDAIVVVENMVRHIGARQDRNVFEVAIAAVAEVGNPTIIATFTIIFALLPMMFVSGLMGPYMSPIPANASAAMLFSLLMAFTITPWLMMKLRRSAMPSVEHGAGGHETGGLLGSLYLRIARPLLQGRRRSKQFLVGVGVATVLSLSLFATKSVPVKLLPFDNKSELQVIVDLPRGASIEDVERVLFAAAARIQGLPELLDMQVHAGTAAPFNFNGLVRHYYVRQKPELGDLQINLQPKESRTRDSHEIALDIRRRLSGLETPDGSVVKIVEVPPGPPVIAALLAEIYGPDEQTRRAVATEIRRLYRSIDFVADDDVSFGTQGARLRFAIDQEGLEFHRVEEAEVYGTLRTLLGGRSIGYSHRGKGINPVEIAIRLPKEDLVAGERLLATPVPTRTGGTVELGDLVNVTSEKTSYPIFRRDGRFAEMVMAELAGRFEAPIYGMLAVQEAIERHAWPAQLKPAIRYAGQPMDESRPTLLWDGEWEITYVTFRDMGGAFIVALLGIYLLVVGQFRNFRIPLLVLVPVPLTLLGIMIGHWSMGAAFTATSMIGFIALAGIVVRNSILLIDFIRGRRTSGAALRDVLLEAGAIRFKPIFLTAAAAMIGSGFILADPIFQGLAISMLFGLASSTLLTVLVIPALYVWLRDDGRPATV